MALGALMGESDQQGSRVTWDDRFLMVYWTLCDLLGVTDEPLEINVLVFNAALDWMQKGRYKHFRLGERLKRAAEQKLGRGERGRGEPSRPEYESDNGRASRSLRGGY